MLFRSIILYRNDGPTVMSGDISLDHDTILKFIAASPVEKVYQKPIVKWSFTNLIPNEQRWITISFYVPTIDKGGYLGRVLKTKATIEPISGDASPVDNSSLSSIAIKGAFDPNIKEVMPQGNVSANDSVLHYWIHFQNTGTDTAFKVVVKDSLSPSLDITTLKSGASSHPYFLCIEPPRTIVWTFDRILLVDSTTNEEKSHGFVEYSIKQAKGNIAGNEIKNKAGIYFDYNPPIITNTTLNTFFGYPSGIDKLMQKEDGMVIYPNPFSQSTTFALPTHIRDHYMQINVYDAIGRQVYTTVFANKVFTLSRGDLGEGIYFYVIKGDAEYRSSGKIVISR